MFPYVKDNDEVEAELFTHIQDKNLEKKKKKTNPRKQIISFISRPRDKEENILLDVLTLFHFFHTRMRSFMHTCVVA